MDLNDAELRVLGCLVEKEMTTPDYYPLTLNALVAACNQSQNRDPVVDFDEGTVQGAVDSLRERGLVRSVHRPGQRAGKYRHVLGEVLGIDGEQAACLAVLMLRGAQTAGEIRLRTSRYHTFADLEAAVEVLEGLATRDLPLVERLERRPGEKEPRYRHLLGDEGGSGGSALGVAGGETDDEAGGVTGGVTGGELVADAPAPTPIGLAASEGGSDLEARVGVLEERIGRLERALGLEPGATP